MVVHANGTEGIRWSVEAGADVIAHCNWLGVEEGTVEYDPAVARRMAEQGTMVDLTVGGALRPLEPGEGRVLAWDGPTPPRHRWDLILRTRALGVKVYLTSDACGPAVADYPRQVSEMARAADVAPLEAIAMATRLPAEGLGLGGELGTVEPGKLADLTAVAGDPTEDVGCLARARTVIRSGRVVVRDGLLTGPLRT